MSDTGDSPPPGADWYIDCDSSLEQGDVLFGFRVVEPVWQSGADYTFRAKNANVVVLTQTCDIPKRAQNSVLVAEVHDYDALVAAGQQHLKKREIKEALARGTTIAEFLLPPTIDGRLSWSVVSFRDIFVLPKLAVISAVEAGSPLRLTSPYKEYLSQAFGRFVMRVGLPATLSQFEKYTPGST